MAAILDCFDGTIVGFKMASHMKAELGPSYLYFPDLVCTDLLSGSSTKKENVRKFV
ncbi:hypothetical protein SAMN02745123_01014 [Desulforamulus aeronauticus DSM 10349]|uniref:Uncharacterized protein n=1 Tax=Desulforamulus aeronauticus DSM 10349 TaxID=1121421 RepID=A0A1M6QFC4_9FIRM|nr:hypothetical protein SAMN02745123_01014 [Desulforamulus aeronauticus DSM 10349]